MIEETIIQCKVKDIPITKTRKDFLREFLLKTPATYDSNLKKQCEPDCHRSFSDLHTLTKSRFKKTSLVAIIRIVAELNVERICDVVWCNQVKKFVVRARKGEELTPKENAKVPFVTVYSQDYHKNSVGTDGISFTQLMKTQKEQLK